MDEADLGQITRPKENATGELPHIPNERLDPQRSRREKNPIDATYVGPSGRRKTGSGRRRTFPNKHWDTSNILVKPYQQHTSMLITNVGD
jgi:hypothetical protein